MHNFKKNYVTWKNQIKGLNQQAVDFLESKGVSVPLAINYGLGFKKKFEPFYINNINKMIGFDDPKIIIPQTNLDNEVVNLSSNSIQPNFESENNYLPLQISNFNSKQRLKNRLVGSQSVCQIPESTLSQNRKALKFLS